MSLSLALSGGALAQSAPPPGEAAPQQVAPSPAPAAASPVEAPAGEEAPPPSPAASGARADVERPAAERPAEPPAPPAPEPPSSPAPPASAAPAAEIRGDSGVQAARDGKVAEWTFGHFFERIKVRGYTQLRYNLNTNDELVSLQGDKSLGEVDGFSIRRARLVLYGDVHPLVYVYLQPDFAATGADGTQHLVQMRDWYFDLSEPTKQLRLRVGQSKVPFGFENMQSSGNRLPLDRSDAINSALANERDLGVFLYWAPTEIRKRYKHLTESGLKGSGDYGALALGLYNGQTANKPERNDDKHVVFRADWPFLFGDQFVEVWGGGYFGRYVVTKDATVSGPDETWDARANLGFNVYPQPFGLQVEYNVGVGPELRDVGSTTTPGGSVVYSGRLAEGFLHGGYALLSFRTEDWLPGVFIPYVRGAYYQGGKKHETNAPRYEVLELEAGVEYAPVPAFEFTAAFHAAERTAGSFPYQQERGQAARFQLQINY